MLGTSKLKKVETRQTTNVTVDLDQETNLPEPTGRSYLYAGLLCWLIAFSGFVFGWDTGTIGGITTMPDFINRFGSWDSDQNEMVLTNSRTGLIVSIFNLGAAVGGLVLSKIGDKYGRKVGMISALWIYIVGVVLQISSSDKWIQYMVGRIITGLAVGSLVVLGPVYISEISPSIIRGAMVSMFQLMTTCGIFVGYCTCYGTYHSYSDSKCWRIVLGLGFAWALLAMTGIWLSPESPRYLVSRGKIESAKRSVAKVSRLPIDSLDVQREIDNVQMALEAEKLAGNASWLELITGQPKLFYRTVIGVSLEALQQLTGDNSFFYYAPNIFKDVGMSDSYETSMILGIVNFASTFVALYVIDKFGRRKTLLAGDIGMGVCLLIYSLVGSMALYPHTFGVNASKPAGNALIAVTCIYIAFFAITWAPGVAVVVSESFPLRVRSKGMAVSLTANWIFGFLIAYFTPTITAHIHFYIGYIFLGCVIFGFFFVFCCLPETKGLSLEAIDEVYSNLTPGLAFKSAKKSE